MKFIRFANDIIPVDDILVIHKDRYFIRLERKNGGDKLFWHPMNECETEKIFTELLADINAGTESGNNDLVETVRDFVESTKEYHRLKSDLHYLKTIYEK